MRLRHVLNIGLVLLSLVPCPSFAGSVTLHPELEESDGNDMVETWVDASYRYHALAVSRWLHAAEGAETMTRADFDRFARPYLTGTFLTARYTWVDERTGAAHSRMYHAASGPEQPWVPGTVSPPGSAFVSYFESSQGLVHATLGSDEGSSVIHTSLPGERNPDTHRADAEIRMLRSLERDMRDATAGRRGRLDIYVSTKVCDSCEIAIQRFAADRDVDIHIRALSRDPESDIRRAFKRRRKELIDNLQCDLALRNVPSSTRSGSSSPEPFDDSSRSAAFAAGCSGLSVY
ncbi:hypothetical protein L2Y96_02470 [Luteibacter aegosomaticola]|uniref:hypothetical protein n=1 Tax=Luteibacter aegosomaticola TaxID=2911538 RepID=UPI001FF8C1D2|nr:hypothetical protein [Luteibacter aegosomaticola]UPG90657.1 hypothetical protein L2Y96_02470 [Luteibacter aegosomaticola]